MSRAKGTQQYGGRQKAHDPNKLHPYRAKRWPVASKDKRWNKNGKLRFQIEIPPYLYDTIRNEAIQHNKSLNRMAVEMLEAAAADFED